MSWYLDVAGTKEEVTQALDLKADQIPSPVVAYIKDAIAATTGKNQIVRVTTHGHRPMEYGLANEQVKVELINKVDALRPAKP